MSINKIWKVKNPVPLPAFLDSRQGPISPLVASLLRLRGIETVQEQEAFLYNKDLGFLTDPWSLPDMDIAVQRILHAIKEKQPIVIFGDYDVDGITATTLLTSVLTKLGAQVDYYIPDRQEDGYGLSNNSLHNLMEAGTKLVVTVDCGISAVAEANYAKEIGLDLIITDHHQPPSKLPEALATINPKLSKIQNMDYHLAGVGVAYKLACCVCIALDKPLIAQDYLDLVAIGTIADIVPLLGDNRILVYEGLRILNLMPRVGLEALINIAGLTDKEIKTGNIAFAIAPRINASGRLTQGSHAVELLMEDNLAIATTMAKQLDESNRQRQEIEAGILEEALEAIDKECNLEQNKIIVLDSSHWHPGVIGIVASKLTERFHRPTLLIHFDNDFGKGSGRSIIGFNLYDALNACSEFLLGFGGHELAAGFSVSSDNFSKFKNALIAYANERLTEEDMIPIKVADLTLEASLLSIKLVDIIQELAPFGCCNPQPVFILRNVKVNKIKQIGLKKNHIKLNIAKNGLDFTGIGFNMAERLNEFEKADLLDIMFVPEINFYKNRSLLQLNIKDFKNSSLPDNPKIDISFIDQLFLDGLLFLEEDNYRDILNKETFFTKVVGTTFENRNLFISMISSGDEVTLKQEPTNPYDKNAIAVYCKDKHIGYLKAKLALHLTEAIKSGLSFSAYISLITGLDKTNQGVNLCIYRDNIEKSISSIQEQASNQIDLEQIRQVILGDFDYRNKQKEAITSLEQGKNTLLVMGTGRGKSAVFQTMAARLAKENGITILVYPLRSLVNDQYQSFTDKLSLLGIGISKATGLMSPWQRKDFFKQLYNKQIQVILTTPEFLELHWEKFIPIQDNLKFLVIDEAHHMAQTNRASYKRLGDIWKKIGKPLVLAVTATADSDTAKQITHEFAINNLLTEAHCRENLSIVDARGEKDKLAYLIKVLENQPRSIIYVNSRRQSYELATNLRHYLPHLQDQIAFYHGGLDRNNRQNLEDLYRSSQINILVSTSAFGEGIDIPNIRDVILYHLCFTRSEYNQLSGRAGRDGNPARIHLLYNKDDQGLNNLILQINSPDRDTLGRFYLYLRDLAKQKNPISLTNREIIIDMQQRGIETVNEHSITTCLGILEELGLLLREKDVGRRYIHLAPPPPSKLDLNHSARYLEGQSEITAFNDYAKYAFSATLDLLLIGINQPILPEI